MTIWSSDALILEGFFYN